MDRSVAVQGAYERKIYARDVKCHDIQYEGRSGDKWWLNIICLLKRLAVTQAISTYCKTIDARPSRFSIESPTMTYYHDDYSQYTGIQNKVSTE
jgi:hypothetical protein